MKYLRYVTVFILILFFATGDCFQAMAQSDVMFCNQCGRRVWDSDNGLPKPTACPYCGNGKNVLPEVAQQRQEADVVRQKQEAAAMAVHAQIAQLKTASLEQLLGKQDLDYPEYVEALTDSIIDAETDRLPGWLASATVKQRTQLLAAIKKQIARATAKIDEINGNASDTMRKSTDQETASFRKHVGQIKAYIGVLNEIKSILEQS